MTSKVARARGTPPISAKLITMADHVSAFGDGAPVGRLVGGLGGSPFAEGPLLTQPPIGHRAGHPHPPSPGDVPALERSGTSLAQRADLGVVPVEQLLGFPSLRGNHHHRDPTRRRCFRIRSATNVRAERQCEGSTEEQHRSSWWSRSSQISIYQELSRRRSRRAGRDRPVTCGLRLESPP